MKNAFITTTLTLLVAIFTLLTVFIEDPPARVSFVLAGVISFIFLMVFTCRLITTSSNSGSISLPIQEITVPPRMLLTAYPTPSRVKYFSWEKNYLPRKPAKVLPI